MNLYSEIEECINNEKILSNYQELCFSEEFLQEPEQLLFKSVILKDKYTARHCMSVAGYSKVLGREIWLPQDQMDILCKAALFHDLGKTRVPDSILNKEGSLTGDEWLIIKKHPEFGEEMINGTPEGFDSSISTTVRHHHENYNGGGYPDGLSGENIPLASRIIAVADVFDAITSDRPYRKSYSVYEAAHIIKSQCKNKLDPYLANLFMDKVIKITGEIFKDDKKRGRFQIL